MHVLVQNTLTNRQWVAFDGAAGFTIGRDATCEVKLDSRFVSGQHIKVERSEVGWEIELYPGTSAVDVNGTEVGPGQKVQFRDQAAIKLMEFVLTLEDAQQQGPGGQADEQLTELLNVLHANVLRRLDLRLGAITATDISKNRTDQLNKIIDDLLLNDFRREVFESELTGLLARIALRARLNEWLIGKLTRETVIAAEWHGLGENTELEGPIDHAVVRMANKAGIYTGKPIPANADERIDATYWGAVDQVLAEVLENVRTYLIISYVKKTLYDIIFGLGPLEDLLRSPSITEIMVVNPRKIYIERNGRIVKIPQVFPSEEACLSIIERIVAPLGRRIDRSQPLVDARLRDGSRVNAIIDPLAISGPCITIRKFPTYRVTVDDLMRWKSITMPAVALLKACVQYRANILVSGGTGSGKTTLLNVLSGFVPAHERLVTIEDSAELKLQQEHVVSLETKPANSEGQGRYTTRDLVRNSLRMRPDRIIVGECRGDEAVDMLQAMNTGHAGSMTTIHANTTQDAIARLETMVLMGAEIPLPAVRRQIASAIHLIVQQERLPSGQRLVSQVSEVIGLHPNSGEVETRDIMRLVELPNGQRGLKATGYMPRFLGEMVEKGHLRLDTWFEQVRRMNPLLPAFAIVTGFAIACAVWALRDKLWAKYLRDVAWMQATYMRFYPDPINAQSYMLAYYGFFVLALVILILLLPNLILAFGFWFLLLYIPKILIEWAWKRRVRAIDAQISQSVASLSNSMRAGLTLVQAITRLSEQAPDPIKGEFKIMANQYGYGADMETVLKNAKERLKLANFTLFASALLLNREMGGNISETLTRISKSLDKLREMRKTVEAHTAEGRTNIKVLLLAPVVMLLMMATVDSSDVGLLFTTTPGIAILVTAAALAGGGAYIASRITRSEV